MNVLFLPEFRQYLDELLIYYTKKNILAMLTLLRGMWRNFLMILKQPFLIIKSGFPHLILRNLGKRCTMLYSKKIKQRNGMSFFQFISIREIFFILFVTSVITM